MKAVPFFLLVVLLLASLAGCSSGSRRQPEPAAATVSAGPAGPALEQTGAAATPAKASRKETRVETFMPAGVEVTAWLDGRITWKTSAPVPVVSTSSDSSATGPQSFTPPAAPTPEEEADGRARFIAWAAIIVGGAAGLFGALRAWPLLGIGGGCVAAAGVAVVALGKMPEWIWTLLSVGLVLGIGGPLVWFFVLKPKPAAPSPLPG